MDKALKQNPKVRRPNHTLSGLPGVRRDRVRAVGVTSVADAMRHVRARVCAVTAAGSDGSLTVWRTDAGALRCEFQRFMVTRSKALCTTLKEVQTWLREWWPQMKR